ncbi:MAG: cytochrome c [Gemmataceae bacterium]
MAGLWLLSGCDEKYPANLKYPVRDDPVLLSPVKAEPTHFDTPGQLFHLLEERIPQAEREQQLLYPSQIPADKRALLLTTLTEHFGTPLQPKVSEIDSDAERLLVLDEKTLAEGSVLYRLHCLHCHGLTGNGRGPTAPWVNPHPRDYRKGIFKFTSSYLAGERRARREDLFRTIREGLNGTTMPAHNTLPDREIDALVSYVIHLSIRGETEEFAMRDLHAGESDDVEELVSLWLRLTTGRWVKTQDSLIVPGPYTPDDQLAASIANGYRMFVDPSEQGGAACISCHQDFGRKETYKNDVWGTIVRPANLTKGIYRGGRRPLDLYWRIHSGINGAEMPASFETSLKPTEAWLKLLGENVKAEGADKQRKDILEKEIGRLKLPESDLAALKQGWDKVDGKLKETVRTRIAEQRNWDLVNFLLNLPYPEMRKKNHIDIHAGGEAE